MEDINNILNAGDVPNIYTFDDLEQIYAAMKPVLLSSGVPATKANLFSTYIKTVHKNMHTVITMRSKCSFITSHTMMIDFYITIFL